MDGGSGFHKLCKIIVLITPYQQRKKNIAVSKLF